jgi:hypothetical protein
MKGKEQTGNHLHVQETTRRGGCGQALLTEEAHDEIAQNKGRLLVRLMRRAVDVSSRSPTCRDH